MAQTDVATAGEGNYEVQQGECLLTIAARTGHFWKTIWDHPDNAGLKRVRKDPTVLLPGDRLSIPPIRVREESRPADGCHRFVRKGVPAKLRLRLCEDGRPLKDEPFVLEIGTKTERGTVGADGEIEVFVPLDAVSGSLTIGVAPHVRRYQLSLGHLDPVETVSGAQSRLAHLGFDPGPVDNQLGENTRDAIRRFQLANRMEETGELGAATRQKLKELHGS